MNKEEIEIWKTIEDYPNYMISNLGNVKSLKFGKERILKQAKYTNGYCFVVLSKEGKQKSCIIHRLVATAFIPNPDNLPEVNHKNEIKTDNRLENLEWVTHKQNCNYGTRNERSSKANKGKPNIARQKPIACYNKKGNLVALYTSATQASELLIIDISSIIKCCRGKYKTCGGYIFKYIKKVS